MNGLPVTYLCYLFGLLPVPGLFSPVVPGQPGFMPPELLPISAAVPNLSMPPPVMQMQYIPGMPHSFPMMQTPGMGFPLGTYPPPAVPPMPAVPAVPTVVPPAIPGVGPVPDVGVPGLVEEPPVPGVPQPMSEWSQSGTYEEGDPGEAAVVVAEQEVVETMEDVKEEPEAESSVTMDTSSVMDDLSSVPLPPEDPPIQASSPRPHTDIPLPPGDPMPSVTTQEGANQEQVRGLRKEKIYQY